MITEDYCSYEVSKLLKEKGFDEPCKVWYSEYTSQFGGEKYTSIEFDDHNRFKKDYKFLFHAPTHQMAMKWLREVHNIFIVIEPYMYDYVNEKNSSYVTSLWQGDNYYENITSKDYPAYEEAVEAALKYTLENLICKITK